MNLSEKEQKYLSRFEKYAKTFYLNYIGAGLLLCMTIYGLVIGIKFKSEKGFFMAIFCGSIGVNLLIATRGYEKLYKIILKMKQHIEDLEKDV